MADLVIGKVNSGVAAHSADAMSVTSTLSQTASFQRAMSNPIERDVFLRGLEARKEKALASNDKTMFGLLSAMAAEVKNYSAPSADLYSNDGGFRALG
ncbi:MAG: hypothetical protein K6A44_06355 [bacterium]|nr:hypothetical protein [bacterium]